MSSRASLAFIMTKTRFVFSTFLLFVSMWWGWTVLVDFFIIRTVFANIDSFFQAGNIGIAVFSKLNNLEVIVSTILVALLSFQMTKNKKILPMLIMSLIAWAVVMTYFTYLTPKIVELTDLWKQTDLMGISAVAGIPDIQQEHQFFHRLYIGLDSFKLLILSDMILFGIWKDEQWA